MINQLDVQVYKQFRKQSQLPPYESDKSRPLKWCRNVPVFVTTSDTLDQILALQNSDIIHGHNGNALLILTDRKRVLAVEPQGYDYARYTWSLDEKTAQNILNMV